MNCTTCNTPLATNARFCPTCGTPISAPTNNDATAYPSPRYQNEPFNKQEPPTLPPGYLQGQQQPQPQPGWSQPSSAPRAPSSWSQAPSSPQQQPSPYQPVRPDSGGNMFARSEEDVKPRRRRGGCLATSLITIIVLLLLIVGAWFLAVRPYLDNMAQSKLDGVLNDAVNNIPPLVNQLPNGQSVPITERVINNLFVLASSPNDIVKNPQVHITTSDLRMDFQIYGFSSTVTGVPEVQQGQLVMTNVTVSGLAALILTSDEVTALANRHLVDAEKKINHSITSVQLKDQEMDLVLGPRNGGGGPSTLPTPPSTLPTALPTLPTALPTLP